MALLRHIALRCADMERSRKFYEMLGFRFVDYRPSRQGLDLTDGTINMTLLQQPDADQRPTFEEGTEYIHFGIIVDDLDAVWQKLHEWGAVLLKEDVKQRNPIDPAVRPPTSFKVADPDGNVVDVTCNKEEWRGVKL
jgi:catechol 2,3-dioxygenase-like lactoylglutathione lyase family enzyme